MQDNWDCFDLYSYLGNLLHSPLSNPLRDTSEVPVIYDLIIDGPNESPCGTPPGPSGGGITFLTSPDLLNLLGYLFP
ncbi:hypothetical protein M8J75_005743 [Diaphorina citri]|nr:hypothetical protein M8J75_005743 [Diaphorina citri]